MPRLMPTSTTSNTWAVLEGASALVAVSDDDDATYIGSDGPGARAIFAVADSGAASIASVHVVGRARRWTAAGTSTVRVFWRLGGNELGTNFSVSGTAPIPCVVHGAARPGGGSWSVADVDALEVGLELVASGAPFPADGAATWGTALWAEYVAGSDSVPVQGATVPLTRAGALEVRTDRAGAAAGALARQGVAEGGLTRVCSLDAGLARAGNVAVAVREG